MKDSLISGSKRPMMKVGAAAILCQMAVLILGIPATAIVGLPPDTAQGYFELMGSSPLKGFLADDFFSILLIALYLFAFVPLFFALEDKRFAPAFLAVMTAAAGVVLALSSHTGFSLLELSYKYNATGDEAARTMYLTAGEALIAGNIWNSTGGFFSGLFLQGGGILVSAAMIGTGRFRRLTPLAGIFCNGLDLVNHMYTRITLGSLDFLLYIAGPVYIFWYILLFLDFRRLAGRTQVSPAGRQSSGFHA